MSATARVQRLGLAVMKGVRHEPLPAVELTSRGPAGDRVFCLVDPERQAVLRTVEHPELLGLRARWDGVELAVDLPDGTTVRDAPRPTGEEAACDYWGRRPRLQLLRSAHAAALSDVVGRPVALARARPGDVVYGAPVTVVTTTDLDELGRRTGESDLAADPEQSARFRATITLDDRDRPLPADAAGTRLRIGGAGGPELRLTGPIPRCRVIDLDPSTTRLDQHLLGALAGYRLTAGEISFGRYAEVVSPGRCAAGDDVEWRGPAPSCPTY